MVRRTNLIFELPDLSTPALIVVAVCGRTWLLDFSADQHEDPPVMRRDVSTTTVVEFGALHLELAVDPLLWFAFSAMEKYWLFVGRHSPTVAGTDPSLVQRCNHNHNHNNHFHHHNHNHNNHNKHHHKHNQNHNLHNFHNHPKALGSRLALFRVVFFSRTSEVSRRLVRSRWRCIR